MSDLISRSALINALKIDRACIYSHVFSHVDCDAEEELMIDLVQIINNQPTIEVRPVVHSEWKYYRKKCIAVCKNCSFERNLNENFGMAIACPNCGADMRKGGAE